MSCTKSVVGLAFGALLDSGAIASLEQAVADWYPEWRQGQKRHITVRMLLNHTSGIQDVPNAGEEIEGSPDVVQLALAAELSDPPGMAFHYNNKAVNLLAGIVARASGTPVDQYVARVLFTPLGIRDWSWLTDAAGTPYVMAGLSLHARDLATIGQLLLERGQWQGTPIFSPQWIATITQPGQPYHAKSGLLWWRLPGTESDTAGGYYVDGWLGQYLVVLPRTHTIIVRLVERSEHLEPSTDAFADFYDVIHELG